MKQTFLALIFVATAFTVAAQQQRIERVGVYTAPSGEVVFAEPTTTIAIDLTVSEEQFTAGIYARYAQKYLGVRASLVDKRTCTVECVGLSTLAAALPLSEQPKTVALPVSLLPVNRLDARALTAEQAAAEVAEQIFSLRKHRVDLITGEAGENVFGAGLKSALESIDARESELLSMFFGRTERTVRTVRYTIKPSNDKFSYIVCRFSATTGLLPISDLTGEPMMLQVEPSGDNSLRYIKEATEKERNRVSCVVADNTSCSVMVGAQLMQTAVLPVFQFGRIVEVAAPLK